MIPDSVRDAGGVLTVVDSGFTIPNPAITVHDYGFTQLWDITLSGDNVETIAGHVAYPRVIKQQTATVPILIDPLVDMAGDPLDGTVAAMRANYLELQEELILPTTVVDGAQDVTFEPAPGEPLLLGRIQFVGIQVGRRWPGGWLAVLDLVLPDGPLVEEGS